MVYGEKLSLSVRYNSFGNVKFITQKSYSALQRPVLEQGLQLKFYGVI